MDQYGKCGNFYGCGNCKFIKVSRMATEPTLHTEEDEISVKGLIISIQDWIRYFFSKWIVLLIAGILGALLGLCYSLLKKPQYTATTTFVLEGGDSKGLSQYSSMAAM